VKQSKNIVLLVLIILVSSIGFIHASAEILNTKMVHAMMSNLASVYGKTYPLQVDNTTYNIYYGFNVTYATATNISLHPEHNLIQIDLKDVTDADGMWIQIPQNLISAEKNNFVIHVNGQEKKYELATSGHSTIIGFMIPTNTTRVEIQGTHVVPEFPFAIPIFLASFVSVIAFYGIRFRR
jgi:hypothetical protein